MECIINKRRDEIHSSDTYVQQLNAKELEVAEYDASKFYDDDSPFTQIYIITKLNDKQDATLNPQMSLFAPHNKQVLKNYIIRSEKALYYTLEKTNFKNKLNTNAEFYFADSIDTLVCSDILHSIKN